MLLPLGSRALKDLLPHPPIVPGTGPASWTPAGSAFSGKPWAPPPVSALRAFLRQPAGWPPPVPSSAPPDTPLAVGFCPKFPILVTVCLPESRVLSILPAVIQAQVKGSSLASVEEAENRMPLWCDLLSPEDVS